MYILRQNYDIMTPKHSNTRSEANYIIESLQEFVLEELENGRDGVVSRARVGYSDAQVAECCFEQSVEPGKYTIVLANRALQTACRSIC